MAEISYGLAVKRTVLAIKAVLFVAEERQASEQRLLIWLGELKDVLNDDENVLDEVQCQALQKKVMNRYGSTSKKVRYFFSGSNPLVFPFEMAHKIKDIRKRLDDIAALKDQFNLAQGLKDRKITMHKRDMTHSFVNPSNVIGRDNDKEKIIDLLMQQDAGRNVSVIPIVGIGGLGKTTLANLVYNNEGVIHHFQLRMWVCMSEDFDVIRLIKEILKSANCKIDENMHNQLQILLRECLKDKKFLLVLDDVWNKDRDKWIKLEELLLGAGSCNGSKIIVTTQNDSVAKIMGTTTTYKLDGLSQKECLSLFVKLAFKEGEERQHPNLLKIGEDIVRKCKGVPLAVRTLACLLYSKFDESEWKFVKDNEIWNLEQTEGGILPALKLSYDQLPFRLKQCFAYCFFSKGLSIL
uniref:NB-ARC domain-containing protein n=1 Tax=Fagus sylvatica TaxID=28930 RepID=A0A2N9GKH8_FAGSY